MRQIFGGGVDDLQHGSDFFWQVRREQLKPEQVERVLEFWKASLSWAKAQPQLPQALLSRLSRPGALSFNAGSKREVDFARRGSLRTFGLFHRSNDRRTCASRQFKSGGNR